MSTTPQETSEFQTWAEKELRLAGLFDKDSDYEGMIGDSVLELVNHFAGQGHSGYSAMAVMGTFERLVLRQPLTQLTDNPDEWIFITNGAWEGDPGLWQSARQPAAFSNDQGQTYYDLDEKMPWWRNRLDRIQRSFLFNHWFRAWRFQKRHKTLTYS